MERLEFLCARKTPLRNKLRQMIKYNLSFLACLLFCGVALAQDFYAVQIGTFLNPRADDFKTIRSAGYIYAEEDEGDVYRIFMGDYAEKSDADKMVQRLRQSGYSDAKVVRRTTSFGQKAAVIQMATYSPKDRIDWASFYKAGEVYVLIEKGVIKLVTGVYLNLNDAKADLARVRQAGFKDAFPKEVNSARLHQPTDFELGSYKKPFIPIDLSEREEPTNTKKPKLSFGAGNKDKGTGIDPGELTEGSALPVPKVRTNVKRASVLDLQTTLRALSAYPGALDGYYGKGTADGFVAASNANQQFQKYKILAQSEELLNQNNTERMSSLQVAINDIWSNPADAYAVLERANQPIAKAYRAYVAFKNSGASSSVNGLMNQAIQAAFQNTTSANRPPIDPYSTYAYNDYEQLVRHITFIHQVQDLIAVPCWMFEQHPQEVRNALIGSTADLKISESCSNFYQWEIVKMLKVIADDLDATPALQSEVSARLSQLFLVPSTLNATELEGLATWNQSIWTGINNWSRRDVLNEKITTALQLTYYQTQVLLEDHFMDRGFSPQQAQGLALAVLKEIVGKGLGRFV